MPFELIEKSKKYLWLPFTQMKDYDENPFIIESGNGIKVKDNNGKEYVFMPPHASTREELKEMVGIMKQAITEVTHEVSHVGA